jgi:hypothetical protein
VVVVVVVVVVVGLGVGPHKPHITGHNCFNLGPINGLLHLSSQSQVPDFVGQISSSSQASVEVVVVVVVVVVVLTHTAHITGHAIRTLSRSPFVSQSHNPTNVGHIGSSSQSVVVVVLIVVVEVVAEHKSPAYAGAGKMKLDSVHVHGVVVVVEPSCG